MTRYDLTHRRTYHVKVTRDGDAISVPRESYGEIGTSDGGADRLVWLDLYEWVDGAFIKASSTKIAAIADCNPRDHADLLEALLASSIPWADLDGRPIVVFGEFAVAYTLGDSYTYRKE